MKERTNRVSRLLQRELGEIFRIAGNDLFKNIMLTVTNVRVSADLSVAKVYISIFPADNKEEVLIVINEHKRQFRHQLAQKIKNQVRKIPELAFFLDDSLDYIEEIENLLD